MELKEKIEKAKNLAEMNELRLEVVQARNQEILVMWQKKYWAMKRCATCGRMESALEPSHPLKKIEEE